METLQLSTIPLLLSASDAAKLLGIGQRHFYALVSSGKIGPVAVKLGRRSLWRAADLESWVEAGCPVRQLWQSQEVKK